MIEHSAVFDGEYSAHYHFEKFFNADSGMLVAMHTLAVLAEQGKSSDEFVAEYNRYGASGEINSCLGSAEKQQARQKETEAAFADRTESLDWMDGLTIELVDSKAWFNVWVLNTEPLLRLNVEASTYAKVDALVDEAFGIVRG